MAELEEIVVTAKKPSAKSLITDAYFQDELKRAQESINARLPINTSRMPNELEEVVITAKKPPAKSLITDAFLQDDLKRAQESIKAHLPINISGTKAKPAASSTNKKSNEFQTMDSIISSQEAEIPDVITDESNSSGEISTSVAKEEQVQQQIKANEAVNLSDGQGQNFTDPKVLHDPNIDRPGIARPYERQNKHLNENGEIGTIEPVHSTKVDAIGYPLVQINNQTIEEWQIIELRLISENFVPELVLKIKDTGRFEEKNGATQANNEIKVIMVPKSQKTYRAFQLKFIIDYVDYGDEYTSYYSHYKFLNFNQTYTTMLIFPGCGKCPQPPNEILNTWEMCHRVHELTGLGFAATKKTKEIEDRVERYMLTENYKEFLEKHNQWAGLDEDSVLDLWVDFYGYINLVNLSWVLSQKVEAKDLSFIVDIGFHSKTNESIELKTTKTNRIITNFNLMTVNNNAMIKDYATDVNNDGFNYGSLDKLFSYKFEDHNDAKDLDSNKMEPQDLEIVQKTVDGSHVEEYTTANLAELVNEPDKLLHNRQRLIKTKFLQRKRQKMMKIKMVIPNFGLYKGILVYIVICERDPMNKQRILTSAGNVYGETGEEKMAKPSLPEGMTARDLIQNDSVALLNEYLSGVYYIDGVEYRYETTNPDGEIEQYLTVYKQEQDNGYSNKHTEVRVDYDTFKKFVADTGNSVSMTTSGSNVLLTNVENAAAVGNIETIDSIISAQERAL